MYKRAVFSLVSIVLFLVVSVASIVVLESWFHTYSSEVLIDSEKTDSPVSIKRIIEDVLYLRSQEDLNLSILKIVDDKGVIMCEFEDVIVNNYSGRVGYWTFDNISFNGTDYIAKDYSGKNNDGVLLSMNETNVVDSLNGKALQFNGVDESVSIPILNSDSVTLLVKFKRDYVDLSNADALFGGWRWNSDAQVQEGFEIRFYQGSAYSLTFILVVEDTSNARYTYQSTNYVYDVDEHQKWDTVIVSYNDTSGETKLFLNGKLIEKNMNPANRQIFPMSQYEDMRIGYSRVNSGWFNGSIDEVQMFNHSFSDLGVEQLYWDSMKSINNNSKEISIRGCNLTKGDIYNVVIFANNHKAESYIIAE